MKINLIELFEETVKKYPQKVAVIDKDREITFSDLQKKSLQLASTLIAQGVGQNKPVGVFLDKSIESVYADLGILYAGDFYMNLDIKTPAERIRNIIQLVEPAAIISTSRQIKPIEGIIPETVKVVLLDEVDETAEVDARAIARRLSTIIDTDPSCIINTSGSTGTPKGVVLNHKSFFDFIEWALETFHFGDDLWQLSPLRSWRCSSSTR